MPLLVAFTNNEYLSLTWAIEIPPWQDGENSTCPLCKQLEAIEKMISKNYKAAKYTVEIVLAKPADEVFNQLICLSKWWPEDFEGENLQLNSEFVLTTGDAHYSKNKVVEFVPDKKLVWLTTKSIRKTDGFDWTGTKMIFALTPQGDNTLLQFTYDGVVLEDESDRLVLICDMTIKEIFYNYIVNGITK